MKKIYLSVLSVLGFVAVHTAATPEQASRKSINDNASVYPYENKVKCNSSKSQNAGVSHLGNMYRQSLPGTNLITSQIIFTDNFDGANDTSSLQARGYLTYYRGGGPPGSTATWYQGVASVFPAFNGPADGYVAANYNTVTLANNIDNWLVLPELAVDSGDQISFYSLAGGFAPDSLHVWYSASGDSTPEGLDWVLLGEFEVNAIAWEYKEFVVPVTSANGRLAIRYAVVDGGPNGANSDFVGIDQLDVFKRDNFDGELLAITSPASACLLTPAENVTIEVKNNGLDTLYGFDLSYTVDAGTPVVETPTDSIYPGTTYTYTFLTPADVSAVGPHTIDASFLLPADSTSSNDSKSVTVSNIVPSPDPQTTLYSMDFEPTDNLEGWKILDANNDGATWDTTSDVSLVNAYSGAICMRKVASVASDDDWLFSSCIDMTMGSSYTLDYWFKVFDAAFPTQLDVYIGLSQDPIAMTQMIGTNAPPGDTSYQHGVDVFTVPANGTYYLGFHSTFPQGSGSLRLDYIHMDDGTFIGIKENTLSRTVSVYPNPGNGKFAVKSTIPVKNAVIEVFNVSGQLVYSNQLGELNLSFVDLSKQSDGVYNVRITSNSKVENQRIIISR